MQFLQNLLLISLSLTPLSSVSKVMEVRAVQLEKMASPSNVTLAGMVTEPRLVHVAKACVPISAS